MRDHVDKVISKFIATILLQEEEDCLTESDSSAINGSSSECPGD